MYNSFKNLKSNSKRTLRYRKNHYSTGGFSKNIGEFQIFQSGSVGVRNHDQFQLETKKNLFEKRFGILAED